VADKSTKAKGAKKGRAKGKPKAKKSVNFFVRWWRETVGELRKVSWPTPQEAWQLTKVVVIVMAVMSALLGLLDFLFSRLIALVMS
jgi:preprotein translocase subunit SecE